MGRHSSPAQWPFYRSLAGWLLPWVMIAAIVGIAVWVGVASMGGNDVASPALSRTKSPTPKTAPVSEPPPAPRHTHTPAPKPSDTPSVLPKLITNGVSVQVLNGTSVKGADDAMAQRLEGLGFRIVAVVQASKPYDETTVFWSSDASKPAAQALADHFGWVAEPKPANLSPDVSVHVVVGRDEAGG